MRCVILGKFYLLAPQFPEMRGVRLTYARVFLSLIPSLNILWHYVKGTLYSPRK